jgi:DNA topoisomerase-like protein
VLEANFRCDMRLRTELFGARLPRPLPTRPRASRVRLPIRVEDKRQGPPKLHDLPSLQKVCGSRFGWPASKTLEVAQELYDDQGKKIITYPRAEVRYLPQSLITDACRLRAIAVTSGPNSLSRLANAGLDPTISTSGLSQ